MLKQATSATSSAHKLQPHIENDNAELRQVRSVGSYDQNNEPNKPISITTLQQNMETNQLMPENAIKVQIYDFEQEEDQNEKDRENPEILSHEQQKNISIQQIQPIQYQIPNPAHNRTIYKECIFCAEMLREESFEQVFACQHRYCKNCLILYFENQIKNLKLLKCPMENCHQVVNQKCTFYSSISKGSIDKYELIKFRKDIQNSKNLALCPDENCKKGYINVKQGCTSGQCIECKVIYCLKCKIKSHDGECENFQQILLKNKFKYKRCHGCKRIVQRNEGCPHITCKCGSQFCYYCGRPWKVPHRCLRFLAGGELITDKLNKKLKCMRPENFQYDFSIIGYITRLPYYLLCFLILFIYSIFCIMVFLFITSLVFAVSAITGYFILVYKLCKDAREDIKCILIVLSILFLPIAFIIGVFMANGFFMYRMFPKYLEFALAARL